MLACVVFSMVVFLLLRSNCRVRWGALSLVGAQRCKPRFIVSAANNTVTLRELDGVEMSFRDAS